MKMEGKIKQEDKENVKNEPNIKQEIKDEHNVCASVKCQNNGDDDEDNFSPCRPLPTKS